MIGDESSRGCRRILRKEDGWYRTLILGLDDGRIHGRVFITIGNDESF